MNDIEFETLARTSAAGVRAEAARIADSRSALQAVLDSTGPADDVQRLAEIVELDSSVPARRRPTWLPLTAAAATVAAIAGVVFLTNGADDNPAVTTDPITVPIIEPSVTVEPTPTDPVDQNTTVPTSEAPDKAAVIDVPDDRGPQLERTVLATYETGSGDGALGFEQCQECEPLRPWAPIVTDDGTVFVADAVNGRWMTFRGGAWSSRPYRDGEVVAAAPLVGPDGLIYAMVADSLGQAAPRHIVAYDPVDLTEVASYPQGSASFLPLDLIDGNVTYSTGTAQGTVTDFELPAWSATASVIWSANQVEMSISGITRRFQFPDDWSIEAPATYSVPDGSVVVTAHAPATDGSLQTVLVRLWVDGSTSVGMVGPYGSSSNNLEARYSSAGYVRLEEGAIVRYAWPEFTEVDRTT